LGFREYVSKQKHLSFFSIWKELRKDIKNSKNTLENKLSGYENIWHLDILFLSDTLVLCLSCKDENQRLIESSIGHLILTIESFFMYNFKRGVFFRGAISFGEFICDEKNNIAMGDAIDEAYEWHDSTDWIGIILTPSAKFTIDKILLTSESDSFLIKKISSKLVNYNVPFKTSLNFPTYSIVWFEIPDDLLGKGLLYIDILKVLSGLKYSQSTINKYMNTVVFVEKQLGLDIDEYKKLNTRMIYELNKIKSNECNS